MVSSEVSDVDLVDPAIYREGVPHEFFSKLRAEGAVHRHRDTEVLPGQRALAFWSIVRHAEVVHANRDWETFTATDSVSIPPSRARITRWSPWTLPITLGSAGSSRPASPRG